MRNFAEVNKVTGSDQKDLLYSVTGHAGGLEYELCVLYILSQTLQPAQTLLTLGNLQRNHHPQV